MVGWISVVVVLSLGMGGCDFITNASRSTAGFAFGPSLSSDGRYLSFVAHDVPGSDLVAPDGGLEVFVRDLLTGTVTGISRPASGSPQGGAFRTSISADGQVVAFADTASNLAPGDTNDRSDVFVQPVAGGPLQRLSENAAGEVGNGDSRDPSISADGNLVAFSSEATNLLPGVFSDNFPDVYVANIREHTLTRLTVDGQGGFTPSISADGRFVAYAGFSHDTFAAAFVTELATGTTTLASVGLGGAPANNASEAPTLSADGRYVAFDSFSSNLVPQDTGGVDNIYRRDRLTGTTEWVSVAPDGTPPTTTSRDLVDRSPQISADGRFVAFNSNAVNLSDFSSVPHGASEVFVRDVDGHHTTLASSDNGGFAAQGAGVDVNATAALSGDGRYVAFGSSATNLIEGEPSDSIGDIYVRYSTTATIDTVTPPLVVLGTSATVELHGSGYFPGATLSVEGSRSGGNAQVSDFTVVNATTARFTLTVPADANADFRNLTLTNIGTGPGTGATSVVQCIQCISVGTAAG